MAMASAEDRFVEQASDALACLFGESSLANKRHALRRLRDVVRYGTFTDAERVSLSASVDEIESTVFPQR